MVDHRYQNAQGEWQEEEPTPHDVRVYAGAATNVADSSGSGNGSLFHGRLKTEAWTDKKTIEKRTGRDVEVSDYVGSFGAWVKQVGAARIELTRRSSPQAV